MNALIYKFLPPRIGGEVHPYLENEMLRFSQPAAMNDPFECANFEIAKLYEQYMQICVDHLCAEEARHSSSMETRVLKRFGLQMQAKLAIDEIHRAGPKALINEIRGIIKAFGAKIGVLSLTQRWNSSLMWAHYAEKHTGYCVGFETEHPFFMEATEQKTKLRAVTYGQHRIDFIQDELGSTESLMLFYKAEDWAYEKESRIALHWNRQGPLQVHDTGKQCLAGESIKLIQVPHQSIRELILGMLSPPELRIRILGLGKRISVPVFEVLPSLSDLSLTRQRIA